ncbi:unnamed protein product [Diplocarpon coronariae]
MQEGRTAGIAGSSREKCCGQNKSIWSYTFSPLRARSTNRFNPVGFYEILVLKYKAGSISFRDVVSFNLDEYFGIPHEHPESYHTFMYKYFFSHVNVHPRNIHILNGSVTDLEAECVPTGKILPSAVRTGPRLEGKQIELSPNITLHPASATEHPLRISSPDLVPDGMGSRIASY